ncbi:hypothetical protein HJC23_001753 [Cyclotella cryptica]|uniref:RING-type domain-containing protein n=1 Tax=Cyclotella cryptica TaxID=29204 RepID=A0ABD3QP82_9STRA|eukprot:CCRYP_003314-RA/>CCRYP_003314-RA protein AED:0.29 eAED:0.29 QI:218/1/1/1/1/1/4/466/334
MEHETRPNKTTDVAASVAMHEATAPKAGIDRPIKNALESSKPNTLSENQKTTDRGELSNTPQLEPSPRILHGPTLDGDSVDFPLSNLQDHLICPLCGGYFRDPYTVADCLHSFCRSCLIVHFRVGHRRCPTCNLSLEPDPFREVLADRTLQEVVDKIFPWMRKKEDEEEKAFYAARGIKLKPEYESVVKESPGGGGGKKRKADDDEGDRKSAKDVVSLRESTNDMLDLQLEPYETPHEKISLPPLRHSILRTSGRLRIGSIKKYVLQRLGLKDSKSSIEILCNDEPVGNEHSLTFILRTRWFSPNKLLTLHYRLVEDKGGSLGCTGQVASIEIA